MKKYLVFDSVFKNFSIIDGESYSSTYEMIKKNVGGRIECVENFFPFCTNGLTAWANDEGKLLHLPYSTFHTFEKEIYDIICGNLVFSRVGDEGETLPLTDDDIDLVISSFGNNLKYIDLGDSSKIKIYPVFELD